MSSKIKSSALGDSSVIRETISTRKNTGVGETSFVSAAGCAPPMNDQDREAVVNACVREVLRVLDRRAER